MKKVIVIGCPGSGKTTFAEKLRDCVGLPLFYLDAIWHKPDRTHISREEYDGVEYTVINYMFDDGENIVELCFWTIDTEEEYEAVDEIMNTLKMN